MESFFLAETTKYLYLLFDANNFLHGESDPADNDLKCKMHSQGYIFNTEAHPIDIGALKCCHTKRIKEFETKVTPLPLTCKTRNFDARLSFGENFIED